MQVAALEYVILREYLKGNVKKFGCILRKMI